MTTLECQDASVVIGAATLLADATLIATPGELIAIVGPNGAGKTTLMSVLSGDRQPDSGIVSLGGQLIRALSVKKLARLRSVLPQQTKTLFSFTARDVVTMGRFDCDNSNDDESIIDEVMALTGTSTLAHRNYPSLSGGEQSLVNLARVLAQHTPIVMLDEPTAALDVANQEHVCGIARSVAHEGRTVIAVLHDLNLASRYADRIVVLSSGRIVADASPLAALTTDLLSDVYRTPLAVVAHPFHSNIPLVLATSGGQYVS